MKKYVEIVGGTPPYTITFDPSISGNPFTFDNSGIKEFDVLEGVPYHITCTDSSVQVCSYDIYCGTPYTTTTTTSGLINVYWSVSSNNCNYGIFMIQLSGGNTVVSTTSNTGGTFTLPINSFIYVYLNDGLCDQATLTVNNNVGYSSGGYVDYTINNAITDVYITGISYIVTTTTTTLPPTTTTTTTLPPTTTTTTLAPTTTTTTTPSYYAFVVCYSSIFLDNACECINMKTVFSNVPVPGVGDYLYSDVELTNEWSNNYVILFVSPNLYPGWTVLTHVIDTGRISTIYYQDCANLPATTTTTTTYIGPIGTTTTTTQAPCFVWVPEIFWPDGNPGYDYFQMIINTNCYPNAKLLIFNRWDPNQGTILFEKEHYGNLDYWSGSTLDAWWWGNTEIEEFQGPCSWPNLPGKIVKFENYVWVLILGDSPCGCPNKTLNGTVQVAYNSCPPNPTTTTTTTYAPLPPLSCSGLSASSECNISGCTIQSPCDTTKINGRSIFVSKDGTKMFLHVDVVGDPNLTSRIFSYTLTTPYTPASAVYVSEMGLNIPLPSLYSRHDIYFSDDGTTLLVTILATNWSTTANPLVETYVLSTPWDITSSNTRYITQLYCNLISNKYQQTISFNENNILATFEHATGTGKYSSYKNIDIKTIKNFVGINMEANITISNSSYGNNYEGTRIGTNLDYFYFLLQNNSGNYNVYKQPLGTYINYEVTTTGVTGSYSTYKTKYPENFMYAVDVHVIDSNGKAYILEDNRGKSNILFPRVGYYP